MSDSSTNFFQESNPKLDEIKKALESDSVSAKLDAMKRLIAMISKGRDVSSLFPNVVKNVICPNTPVKRLVYMYLIHYAEFEQDLALLSINTFQKDLDDPSPLIRSQALRVLSSIRLKVITHILIISIKRCVSDNAPYVRKTAAHAIPKVFNLDRSQKDELVDAIETLLGDNTTLVLGSALTAFHEVCPERVDLLHPHFRKFCNMMADIDEWGQLVLLNVFARYARTQFANPDPTERGDATGKGPAKKKASSFYSDDDSADDDMEEDDVDVPEMDSDHRLLLRAAGPLLQSRNNGVVVAAAMLFFYCAPQAEALKIGKPLIRIVYNPPQISYFVLQNILTMSRTRPELFSPYVSEFFVYDTDPHYIRELKLEILTNVATETNITRILKEFTHYVKSPNKQFVTDTIQAIGTSAIRLPEVHESCMQGLISLLSNRSEAVVAESVVVIKKLLQLGAGTEVRIITRLAKLLDSMNLPKARASIIWIVGEYCEQIPDYAPDILRVLASSFKTEDKVVKQQIITLGNKLLLRNPSDQTISMLFQYVCNMAKFDMNYDLRDRTRVFRTILVTDKTPSLKQHALQLLCCEKPAPEASSAREGDTFVLNSLSHVVNHTAVGYQVLKDWPTEVPDPSVRNQVARKQRTTYIGGGAGSFTPAAAPAATGGSSSAKGFYSDEESSEYSDFSDDYGDSDEDDFYGSSSKSSKKKSSSSSSAAASFFGEPAPAKKSSSKKAPPKKANKKVDKYGFSEDEEEDFSDFSDEEDTPAPRAVASKAKAAPAPVAAPAPAASADDFFFGGSTPAPKQAEQPQSNFSNDLLGLDFGPGPSTPTVPLSSGVTIAPNSPSATIEPERPRRVLLKEVVSQGLKVEYVFLRRTSMHGPSFNPIQLFFTNKSQDSLKDVVVTSPSKDEKVKASDVVSYLPSGGQAESTMDVKFTSPTMPIKLKVTHESNSYSVEMLPAAGELITQNGAIVASDFPATQKKLGGMQEVSGKFPAQDGNLVAPTILSLANVALLKNDVSGGIFYFAGNTISDNQTLLISVEIREGIARLKVNSSNAIFANTLHRDLKKALEKK